MFKKVELTINGGIIKNLASLKIGKLSALTERKLESIDNLDKYKLLAYEYKSIAKSGTNDEIKIIENSIAFLETIKKYLNEDKTYTLTLRELNFLDNDNEINYKGD